MRILLLSQYFSPEVGATQTRIHTFAAGLANRGHDVTVICEVPNHPQGVVHPGYRKRPLVTRRRDGFKTLHVWVHATVRKTARSRIAFYASYAAAATAVGALSQRPDVVFASSPPLFVAPAAAMLARRHRVPWVMDVRDLWPAAAVALGELSEGRALRWASRLEHWLYRDAAAITVVTEPFARHVGEMLGGTEKVRLIPNGTTARWVKGAELAPDRRSLGLAEKEFLWMFAGNVGAAQGLHTALDAAQLLGEGFRLLVLGDGPARVRLQEHASTLDRAVVEFRDQVSPEMAVRYLRAADCLLVALSDHPVLESFVPSKLYDCCAVGRPVVVSARGEARRLALAHDAALAVDPGDSRALAAAVRRLAHDESLRERLTHAGRTFGKENLREDQVQRLAELLEGVSATRRGATRVWTS